jgi:hypothetical protein
MKMLQQMVARDGDMVWVRGNYGHYGDKLALFERDSGTILPRLPAGITERIYEPGVRHALIRGSDVVDGGPMPWPEGDRLIERDAELINKKRARDEAEFEARKTTMQEQDGKLRAAVEEKLAETKRQEDEMRRKAEQRAEEMRREDEERKAIHAAADRQVQAVLAAAREAARKK